MSNGEKLFEAIDSISGPLVDEAAEFRFKKDRFLPRVLAAAAAIIILGGDRQHQLSGIPC